jgi:zinc transport system permease protein
MFEDFMIRAFVAGIGFAIMAGPLGCFVVWRRMAFFGDTLAHASLCGIALGILGGIDPFASVLIVCLGVGVLLAFTESNFDVSLDSLLSISSQGVLALGILGISMIKGVRLDLNAYFFGDILSVTSGELWLILGGGIIIWLGLYRLWSSLVSMTVAEDLAAVEGVPINYTRFCYMALLAIFIALSIKIVGVLLITALLILPPSIVKSFSKSPEQMSIFSSLLGVFIVTCGLAMSVSFDVPTAPAIVLIAISLLIFKMLIKTR